MKRALLICALLLTTVACETVVESIDKQVGERFRAYFADDTRTYLDDNMRLRWSEGDIITIFEGSTRNKKYRFLGKTGDNAGEFENLSNIFGTGNYLSRFYAIYPYQESTAIHEDGYININWPAEQLYAPNTVGLGANIMVAATEDLRDYDLYFRNAGSYLRLKLYGEEQTVGSIVVTATGGELLSGASTIYVPYNADPVTVMNEGSTSVTLQCGEGITVGATEAEATEFWVVLPPATMTQGIVVTVNGAKNGSQSFEVSAAVNFQRNKYNTMTRELTDLNVREIVEGNPFKSITFVQSANEGKMMKSSLFVGASSSAYYTNSTTARDIYCSYNAEEGVWEGCIPYMHNFNGLVASFATETGVKAVYVNDVEQISGQSANDFTSEVTYLAEMEDGTYRQAIVRLKNTGLPVVTINGTVYSKETDFDDIEGTSTIDIDGVQYTAGVRLRGNSTQEFPKKPYAIKLDSKAEVLGMPKHKRWVLLANWLDRTLLRNDLAFYIGQQTDNWTPHGEPVELVLNGVHVGNYYLCEQIKIDKNRLNIADVGFADLSAQTEEAVAAEMGFLMECDQSTDSSEIYFQYKEPGATSNWWSSSGLQFYVYIKDPGDVATSTGNGVGATIAYTYIKNYFTTVGTALKNSDWTTTRSMLEYKTWVDHWIMTELTMNQESKHPKSFYMYKDGGGKLCAGPGWDFDWCTFVPQNKMGQGGQASSSAGKVQNYFSMRYTMYYQYLFSDSEFTALVKERWAALKPKMDTALAFLDERAALITLSDSYNYEMWPLEGKEPNGYYGFPNSDEDMSFAEAIATMRSSLEARINWLNTQINNL